MRKSALTTLVALLLTGALMGLPAVGLAAEKKEITIGFSAFAPSLDPQVQFAMPSYSMCRFIFDPLVYFDQEMKVQPWLAEKWEQPDETTWKLYLKKGVKFHNGEPFNAQAVKYTMERYLDPDFKSTQKKMYEFTKSVEIVDDYTVVVKTTIPFGSFLNFWGISSVLPPKAASDFKEFGLHPVGSGPYKLVEYVPNSHVIVEANKDYWGPKPRFDKITFRLIREGSTRVAALLAGEVDLIANVPFDSIPKIEQNPKTAVKTIPSFRYVYLACNQKKFEPFKDKRVRQALYYAVDREAIAKYVFGGMAKACKAPFPENFAVFKAGLTDYKYDPAKAKKMLAEAGYPDGLKITLGSPNGRYLKDVEVATAVAGQLKKAGIETTVAPTDWGVYRTERGKGKDSKFDLWLGAWGIITAEADWAVRWLNHSKTLHGHDDAKIDDLIDQGQQTVDPAKAKDIYGQLQEILWENAPVIYLYWQPSIYGVAKDIADNFEPRPDEFTLLKERYGE